MPTFDTKLDALLDRLHALSDAQGSAMGAYFAARAREGGNWRSFGADTERFMSDKFVALDRDKAMFCYNVCRALRGPRQRWHRRSRYGDRH